MIIYVLQGLHHINITLNVQKTKRWVCICNRHTSKQDPTRSKIDQVRSLGWFDNFSHSHVWSFFLSLLQTFIIYFFLNHLSFFFSHMLQSFPLIKILSSKFTYLIRKDREIELLLKEWS